MANLDLKHYPQEVIDNSFVCSIHFRSGRPAYTYDTDNCDWVPSKEQRFADLMETKIVRTKKLLPTNYRQPPPQTAMKLINPRSISAEQMLAPPPPPKIKAIKIEPISTPPHGLPQKASSSMMSTISLLKSNSQFNICLKNANGIAKPLTLTGKIIRLIPPSPIGGGGGSGSLLSQFIPNLSTTISTDVLSERPPQFKKEPIFGNDLPPKIKIKTEPINDDDDQLINAPSSSSSVVDSAGLLMSNNELSLSRVKVEAADDQMKKQILRRKNVQQIKCRYRKINLRNKKLKIVRGRIKKLTTLGRLMRKKRSFKFLILSYRSRQKMELKKRNCSETTAPKISVQNKIRRMNLNMIK